jgi:hypothetical protein
MKCFESTGRTSRFATSATASRQAIKIIVELYSVLAGLTAAGVITISFASVMVLFQEG